MKAIRICLALVFAMVLATNPGIAAAACDSLRASAATTTWHGYHHATVGGSVNFEYLRATVPNRIPFIHGASNTTLWMHLQDTNKPASFKVGIVWGTTQGLLTSTRFRVYLTSEYGNVIHDYTLPDSVGTIGGQDGLLNIEMEAWGSAAGAEQFVILVNGEEVYDHWTIDGAEDFELARIYYEKKNRRDQVQGDDTAGPYTVSSVMYGSNVGTPGFYYNWIPQTQISSNGDDILSTGTKQFTMRDSAPACN